jgi:hypothetical protein
MSANMARVRRNPLVAAATAAAVLSLSRTMSCMTPYAFRAAGALRRQGKEKDGERETKKDIGKGRRKREIERMGKSARERIKEVERKRALRERARKARATERLCQMCSGGVRRKREVESASARAREIQGSLTVRVALLEHEHRRAWGWRSVFLQRSRQDPQQSPSASYSWRNRRCVCVVCLSVCLSAWW